MPRLNREDYIAIALIIVAAFAFCWPIFTNDWMMPQGGGDLTSFLLPMYRYAATTLRGIAGGSQPLTALLWNPTLYAGAPFAADSQSAIFYPPNVLLFALIPAVPFTAIEIMIALHLALAGIGMYWLIHSELAGQANWQSHIGLAPALGYMASDVFITHFGNLNIVETSAYLPFAFLFLRQALRDNQSIARSVKYATLLGIAAGMSALAGHAQMTYITAVTCGAYGLFELARQRNIRIVGLGAISAAVAFGVAAVALLPSIELLRFTGRAALDYPEATRWSLPPVGLANAINPNIFGRGAREFWAPWNRVEVGYMGLTTLLVAGYARRSANWMLYVALGAGALLVAFGAYTPVHRVLYDYVPGISSMRVPARFVLVTNFALAMLAAHALAERPRVKIWHVAGWLAAGGLASAAPMLLGRAPAWETVAAIALVTLLAAWLLHKSPRLLPLLLFAELFAFGAFVEIDRANPNAGYLRTPAVDWLLSQPAPTRIDVATGQWQTDAPAVFGLESIGGTPNPLSLSYYERYFWSLGYRGSPQYNFLNVQYVVADKTGPPADSSFVPVHNEDPLVDIYLNTNAMPRVHLIAPQNVLWVASGDEAFSAIHAPTFDPSAQVVLESQSRLAVPGDAAPAEIAPNLFYTLYQAGKFIVVAQSPQPAFVVFAEVWYPSWRASVNGRSTEIFRANSAFMAVPVSAGESTIVFEFSSQTAVVGALISLCTWLVCLAVLYRLR